MNKCEEFRKNVAKEAKIESSDIMQIPFDPDKNTRNWGRRIINGTHVTDKTKLKDQDMGDTGL